MITDLTDGEKHALELTAALYNVMARFPKLHPADMDETVRDIHNIQNRIMARPQARLMATVKAMEPK